MDLHTVTSIKRPRQIEEMTGWDAHHAWLAGGTWLFSEPQVQTHTLVDLEGLGWPALTVTEAGLEIAATCKVIQLEQFQAPPDWIAAPLLSQCCHSFLSSFKIWNEATVGGNIALSLPAGPMISLTSSLEGVLTLQSREGAVREVPVVDFVSGVHENVLKPGELLRSVFLPAHALKKRHAFQRFTLTQQGRSEVLMIGTLCPEHGEFLLTITAATVRPVQVVFERLPSPGELNAAIDAAVPFELYLDDAHGSPAHRRHLTYYFAKRILEGLS
jgi:CO/xanthine dehydrogenase FAD-binding subunit